MAWWQVWRRSDDSATVASSDASLDGTGKFDHGPLAATAPSGNSTPMIHRLPDAESTAAVSEPREPQGWRLLPPPALLAHNAMPVTANMVVQRSLAAHIPVSQLAATSRPLGHERRADGPFGTVASVLRTVSASAEALLPATHIVGTDLVLRRKAAAGEGPSAEEYSTPAPRPRSSVDSSVGRSSESTPAPASLMSVSESGSEPPAGPMALRALGVTSPLLSDFTPGTSLTSALSFAAPSPAPSAPSSLIARSPGDSDVPEEVSPRDMPVTARQRRVVEVRSAHEPVSLSAFAATASPSPSSVVARTALATPAPLAESAQVTPRSPSGEHGEEEFESTTQPSTSPPPEIRPTAGRRVGLGMPIKALPPSAISRLPESDPFSGWNESEMPLAPGSSSSTGPAEGGVGGVASWSEGGRSLGLQSASGAPDSTSVRRTAESASPVSGPPLSPESPVGSAGSIDADESTSSDPESHAAPALVLTGLVEHAPLVGHQRLDRSLDAPLAPVSVAGTERGVTSVRVRWGTGSESPNAGTHGNGGARPGSPIKRNVEVSGGSSSPPGFGPDNRTRSDSREPIVSPSPNANRLTSTVAVGSGHAPSALSPQRSTEHPGWSSAPPGPAVVAQRSSAGAGSPTSPGTASATVTRVESSGGSAGASESAEVRTGERSEDEPAAPLRQWQEAYPVQSLLVNGSGTAVGREAGPLLRTPDPSAGRATTLPVVNVNRAAAQASSTAVLMLQREPQLGAAQASGQSNHASPASEHANGDAEMAPTHQADGASTAGGGESAAGGAAGASGPTSAQADAELDRLAGKLYERIRQRVRRELLDDRERAGFALDGMR